MIYLFHHIVKLVGNMKSGFLVVLLSANGHLDPLVTIGFISLAEDPDEDGSLLTH